MAPLVAAMALYGLGALARLRQRSGRPILQIAGALGLTLALSAAGKLGFGWRSFGIMQFWSWILFTIAPVYMVGLAALSRPWRVPGALAAALLVAAGVDGFVVEPRWLELNTVTITSPKLTKPLRIGLVADLQTDAPGDYERGALRTLMGQSPDLVLFAGDFVHLEPGAPYTRERDALRAILREARVDRAPLGAFAVQGDVDRDAWWLSLFDGTGIQAQAASRTLPVDELTLTLLSIGDSRADKPPISADPRFHVVVGHSPDFATTRPPADLLLAGHTHGGQVQLPLIGPILTLTRVPRAMASGHTRLPWGGDLVVSRGVGMERRDAPRVRFLCRPELVIIELKPGR